MNSDWISGLPVGLRDGVVIIAAILLAELVHLILYAALRRAQKWRASFPGEVFLRQTAMPSRPLLILVALTIAFGRLEMSDWAAALTQRLLGLGYIATLTWLTIALIEIAHALIVHGLPEDIQHNVRARQIRTQVYLLRQIAIGLVIFIGFAAILLTFPLIRDLGAGLFASAGVAGLVLGMAARPTLGNLIAGIQIALTQPIRIDDAVVVEGEVGRVVEMNTTYVVIRLWDLRHLIVPISHFIEKPFQNWTRYSSDLIGAVLLQTDYTVPIDKLREHFRVVLESSPLWDGKTMIVQVIDSKANTIELRFLMSARNPTETFDLRCHVRERMLEHLQREYPPHFRKYVLRSHLPGRVGSAAPQPKGMELASPRRIETSAYWNQRRGSVSGSANAASHNSRASRASPYTRRAWIAPMRPRPAIATLRPSLIRSLRIQ